MAAHAWDKRGERTRKRPAPLPKEAAAGARAGGEGLRITGCSLTAYFVRINSPSSLACWLSTSASQPGPGVGGRVRGRGPPSQASVPQLGWGLASLLFQGPLRASNLFAVIAEAELHSRGGGGATQSGAPGTRATTSH